MEDNSHIGTYESKAEAVTDTKDLVKLWLDQIERSSADEKDWREDAAKAEDSYRSKAGSRNREFNIFHANIETLVPALYNSTPIPDVRRRFADADPVGKVVSDIIERALSFAVDTYDFDGMMHATIKDSEITDRGIARVRFVPYFSGEGETEALSYAEVKCEHVLWQDFRRGPGRFWGEVPWISFRHYLSKDELAKIVDDPKILADIPFNYTSDGSESKRDKDAKADVFKRAMVWEIWDKDAKRILFICQDYHENILKAEDDPLGLTNFYPIPKPLQAIEQTGSLVPVTPLRIYESLVDELNTITKRITKLIKTLRPRGLYGGNALDIKAASEADDGELVPAQDAMAWMQNGGLEKAISWFPLDPTTKAIQTLYEQREAVKQTIYEVTGIADILRGATDANETLGAQQLKAQWGSLRIQRRQAEAARFARELFELKAEIIATKFDWPLLSKMTGIELPSQQQKQQVQMLVQQVQQAAAQGQQIPPNIQAQAEPAAKMLKQPSQEEVMGLLQDDLSRQYRIDIESDSTIRNDLTRNQQTMNLFLQGTAQFGQAMGPIIMTDPSMKPVVMEIYGAFARQFKLGRQAEDAITAATEASQASAKQPQKPDPEMQKMQMQAQIDEKAAEHKAQLDEKKLQADIAMNQQKLQGEMALKEREFELKKELAIIDAQIKQQDAAMQEHIATKDQERKEREHGQKLQHDEQQHQHAMIQTAQAHEAKTTQTAQMHETKMAQTKAAGPKSGATIDVKHGADEITGPMSEAISKLAEHVNKSQAQQSEVLMAAIKEINKPKRIVKDKAGKAIGVETVN